MRAVNLRNEGKSGAEIKQIIDDLVPRLHFYYMMSDLDLLGKTSRIKPLNLKIAKLLKTKPVVHMINDRVEVYKRYIGHLNRTIYTFVRLIEKMTKGHQIEDLFITHSCSDDIADLSYELFQNRLKPKKIIMNKLGCVLGAQVGKNTIGVSYLIYDAQRKE